MFQKRNLFHIKAVLFKYAEIDSGFALVWCAVHQHLERALRLGISDDEVQRLTQDGLDGWSAGDALWLQAADELVADHRLTDATWGALSESLDHHQLIDLVFTDWLTLITEFIGSSINMVTGDYSRGCSGFWIENGEIAYPVSEVTIAGNLTAMFGALEFVLPAKTKSENWPL